MKSNFEKRLKELEQKAHCCPVCHTTLVCPKCTQVTFRVVYEDDQKPTKNSEKMTPSERENADRT